MKFRNCQQCGVRITATQGRRFCVRCARDRARQGQREYSRFGSSRMLRGRGLDLSRQTIDTGMRVHNEKYLLIHPDGRTERVPPDFALRYYFGSIEKDGTMKVYKAAPPMAA